MPPRQQKAPPIRPTTASHSWHARRLHCIVLHPRGSVTKASKCLGCANLLLVKIEDGARQDHDGVGTPQRRRAELEQLQAFLLGFHDVCGRQFAFMLHKVEHQKDSAQLLLVSVGPSVVRAGTPAAAHWSCAGGTVHSWATSAEARALLADFEVLPVPKMAKRMQLLKQVGPLPVLHVLPVLVVTCLRHDSSPSQRAVLLFFTTRPTQRCAPPSTPAHTVWSVCGCLSPRLTSPAARE